MAEVIAPAPAHERVVQRCVRAFATLLFVALCVSGPVLYFATPHLKLLSSISFPKPTLASVLDGSWEHTIETHLRESSPLTYHVRGTYCENLWSFGWLDAPRIHQGTDGWMFLTDELVFPTEKFRSEATVRRASYRALHDQIGALGAKTLAVILPDKTRLYREHLGAGARYPTEREALSATLREDLLASGFAVVELRPVFEELKRAVPERLLWYRRDSHWCGTGVTHAALAIDAELTRLGWLADLGPKEAMQPLTGKAYDVLGDMAMIMGIRPESTLGRALTEPRDGFGLALAGGKGNLAIVQPTAPWVVAGTSFSREGLPWVIPMAELARSGSTWRIDAGSVHPGWLPMQGLLEVRDRIVRGEIHPKIVVWEVPERLEVEEPWHEIQAQLKAGR